MGYLNLRASKLPFTTVFILCEDNSKAMPSHVFTLNMQERSKEGPVKTDHPLCRVVCGQSELGGVSMASLYNRKGDSLKLNNTLQEIQVGPT